MDCEVRSLYISSYDLPSYCLFYTDDVVNLRKRINTGGHSASGLHNNFDGTGASNRLNIPNRSSNLPLSNPAINRQLQYMPPPPPGMNQFGQEHSPTYPGYPPGHPANYADASSGQENISANVSKMK